MRAILVLDTNVFLHARSVHTIHWLEVARRLESGVSEVVLAVPPVVLDELERQKIEHESESVRARALDAMRLLRKVFGESGDKDGVVFRQPEVSMELLHDRRVAAGGDHRFGDDQLLGALEALKEDRPEAHLALLTNDEGLQLRSRQRGHRLAELPADAWRPPQTRLRRGPAVGVIVRVGGKKLEGDDTTTVQHGAIANVKAETIEVWLETLRQPILEQLKKEQPTWFARNSGRGGGVDHSVQEEFGRARSFAINTAREERTESLKLDLELAFINKGGVRLEEIAVNPIQLKLGGVGLQNHGSYLRAGLLGGEWTPGLGFNPSESAVFTYEYALPETLQRGTHELELTYVFVSDKLALDGQEKVMLEFSERVAELRRR